MSLLEGLKEIVLITSSSIFATRKNVSPSLLLITWSNNFFLLSISKSMSSVRWQRFSFSKASGMVSSNTLYMASESFLPGLSIINLSKINFLPTYKCHYFIGLLIFIIPLKAPYQLIQPEMSTKLYKVGLRK